MSQIKQPEPFNLSTSLNDITGISELIVQTEIQSNLSESLTETVLQQLSEASINQIADSIVVQLDSEISESRIIIREGISAYKSSIFNLITIKQNQLVTDINGIGIKNSDSLQSVTDLINLILTDIEPSLNNIENQIISQLNLKIVTPSDISPLIISELTKWSSDIPLVINSIDITNFSSLTVGSSTLLNHTDLYSTTASSSLIEKISVYTTPLENIILQLSLSSFNQFKNESVIVVQELISNLTTKIESILVVTEDEYIRFKVKNAIETGLITIVDSINTQYSQLSMDNCISCQQNFNSSDNQIELILSNIGGDICESITSKIEFRTPQILQHIRSKILLDVSELNTKIERSVSDEFIRSKNKIFSNVSKSNESFKTDTEVKSESVSIQLIDALHSSISTSDEYLSHCNSFSETVIDNLKNRIYQYTDISNDITGVLDSFKGDLPTNIPTYTLDYIHYDVNSTTFVVNVATFLSVYEAGKLQKSELDTFLLDMIISTLGDVSKQLVEDNFLQKMTEFHQKLNQTRVVDLELESEMMGCLVPISEVFKSDVSKILDCSSIFTHVLEGKFVDSNAITSIINTAFDRPNLVSDVIKTDVVFYLCDSPQINLVYQLFVQDNIKTPILSLEPTNASIETNIKNHAIAFIKRIFPEIFISDSLMTSKLNSILVDQISHFQIDIRNRIENFTNMIENFRYELEETLNSSFKELIRDSGQFKTCSARIFNVMGHNTATAITEDEWIIINTALNNIFRNLDSILLNDSSVYDFTSMYDSFMSKVQTIYPTETYIVSEVDRILLTVSGTLISNIHNLIDSKIESKISRVDEQFNKLETLTRRSVDNIGSISPDEPISSLIGVSHQHLLMLKEPYINQVIPLVDKSGGNCISFSLVYDPSNIHEDPRLINQLCIPVYTYSPTDHGTEPVWHIDDTSKWWRNLDSILEQCSTYNITAVMTLFDFSHDSNSPYSLLLSAPYTNENWNESQHCIFLDTLISHIKRYGCDYILNMGYGSYPSTDTRFKIYPTSGFLRKLIMYLVYTCGVSSNHLALSATEKSNLYYYNPYCEWKSYDDESVTEFDESSVIVLDPTNGKSSLVTYNDDGKVNGGYAKLVLKMPEKSIISLAVSRMSEFISQQTDINDINVMNQIFSPTVRSAIRYFKNIEGDGFIDFGDM